MHPIDIGTPIHPDADLRSVLKRLSDQHNSNQSSKGDDEAPAQPPSALEGVSPTR